MRSGYGGGGKRCQLLWGVLCEGTTSYGLQPAAVDRAPSLGATSSDCALADSNPPHIAQFLPRQPSKQGTRVRVRVRVRLRPVPQKRVHTRGKGDESTTQFSLPRQGWRGAPARDRDSDHSPRKEHRFRDLERTGAVSERCRGAGRGGDGEGGRDRNRRKRGEGLARGGAGGRRDPRKFLLKHRREVRAWSAAMAVRYAGAGTCEHAETTGGMHGSGLDTKTRFSAVRAPPLCFPHAHALPSFFFFLLPRGRDSRESGGLKGTRTWKGRKPREEYENKVLTNEALPLVLSSKLYKKKVKLYFQQKSQC